jgi:hypothetical protein
MSMSGHAVRFSSSWRMAGVTGVQDMEAEDTRALDQIGSSPAAEAGGPTECLVRRLIPSYWGYPAPTMNREFRPLSAWNTRVNQSNEFPSVIVVEADRRDCCILGALWSFGASAWRVPYGIDDRRAEAFQDGAVTLRRLPPITSRGRRPAPSSPSGGNGTGSFPGCPYHPIRSRSFTFISGRAGSSRSFSFGLSKTRVAAGRSRQGGLHGGPSPNGAPAVLALGDLGDRALFHQEPGSPFSFARVSGDLSTGKRAIGPVQVAPLDQYGHPV